jgi:pimeloyl-ACP methyl ester carboxylesterase
MESARQSSGRYDGGTHGILALPDGRRLAYAVYGDQSLRAPLFYLHGVPGGRHEASLASEAALLEGISLISVDRPGFGDSMPLENRRILDTTRDIEALADALGIQTFGIIGVSGGGPHAAACALALRERVRITSLVSSPAPFEAFRKDTLANIRGYARFLRLDPKRLGRIVISLFMRRMGTSPETFMSLIKKNGPPADRALLQDTHIAEAFKRNFLSVARREDILAQELSLLSNPWGFDLERIETPVHVWHGKEDKTVPWGMGRYLVKNLKRSAGHFADGLGHLLILHKMREIMKTMRLSLD